MLPFRLCGWGLVHTKPLTRPDRLKLTEIPLGSLRQDGAALWLLLSSLCRDLDS
jgi:hypothetical protein